MHIVADAVLLACLADRESEFQCRDLLHSLQERLLRYVPSKGSRWEEAPSVRLCELAGAVAADGDSENIAGINRIVDAPVERHQKVLILIPQVARIHGFTRIQVHLVCFIEICYAAACPIVVLPRIAGKNVEAVNAPCIIVVGICLKELAATEVIPFGISSDAEIYRIRICLERSRHYSVEGIRRGYVKTRAHIEAQGFESMDLIVHRRTAYESGRAGVAQAVIQLRERARADQDIRREEVATAVSIVPVAVCSSVVYRPVGISPIWVLSRIEECGFADGSAVSIVLV